MALLATWLATLAAVSTAARTSGPASNGPYQHAATLASLATHRRHCHTDDHFPEHIPVIRAWLEGDK